MTFFKANGGYVLNDDAVPDGMFTRSNETEAGATPWAA